LLSRWISERRWRLSIQLGWLPGKPLAKADSRRQMPRARHARQPHGVTEAFFFPGGMVAAG